jgi:hypothetical protein
MHFIGMMRAPVHSVDDAASMLGKLVSANLGLARRRGQLSHELFVRTAETAHSRPASNSHHNANQTDLEISAAAGAAQPIDVLAIDSWATHGGLAEHYSDATAMAGITDTMTGPMATSVWTQPGGFAEW